MNTHKSAVDVGRNTKAVVPVADQTTIRVSRVLHEKLKVVAAIEGNSLMELTESVLEDFVQRYESISGRVIAPSHGLKSLGIRQHA
ncbi:MAG: hypothetical protein ACREPQ_14830 [Rhodanobacter sp.]